MKLISVDGKSRKAEGYFERQLNNIPVELHARGIDIYEDGTIKIDFDVHWDAGYYGWAACPTAITYEYNDFMNKLASDEITILE